MELDRSQMKINSQKQKGFALIFVMVFIAMIMAIVGDIVYQTQITAKNSIVQEDQLLATMAARTGVEFAKFLLILNNLSSSYQGATLPIPKNMYSILNGQPIGAESFSQIESLTGINLSEALAPEILEGLRAMKGYFVLNISSENTKFNLNLLQSTYAGAASNALLRIFSSPESEKFLSLYNYTPAQLVDNLSAYIKISASDTSLNSRVEPDYNHLNLKYKPKHGALETVEELRRIPGFEVDDIYNMYLPYFTIWPISGQQNSLNINTASTELIASLMVPRSQEVQEQEWDSFDDYRLKNTFAQNSIGTWFQKNIQSYAEDKDADEIRTKILGVTDSIYRIECRGVVNNFEKKLVLVLSANLPSSGGSGAGGGSGSGSGTGSASGAGSGSAAGSGSGAGGVSGSGSGAFNVLYSQWID
ncbi:MAG: hypothetical protein V4591_02250 [Bdellovibrionota bacterium]